MQITVTAETAWAAMRPALETMCKSGLPMKDVHEMIMKAYIDVAVKQHRGNLSAAGRSIGVHRNTLYRYVHR